MIGVTKKRSEFVTGTLEYFVNVGEVEGPAFAKRRLRSQFHKMDSTKFEKLWTKVKGHIKIEAESLPEEGISSLDSHEQLLRELELENW